MSDSKGTPAQETGEKTVIFSSYPSSRISLVIFILSISTSVRTGFPPAKITASAVAGYV